MVSGRPIGMADDHHPGLAFKLLEILMALILAGSISRSARSRRGPRRSGPPPSLPAPSRPPPHAPPKGALPRAGATSPTRPRHRPLGATRLPQGSLLPGPAMPLPPLLHDVPQHPPQHPPSGAFIPVRSAKPGLRYRRNTDVIPTQYRKPGPCKIRPLTPDSPAHPASAAIQPSPSSVRPRGWYSAPTQAAYPSAAIRSRKAG